MRVADVHRDRSYGRSGTMCLLVAVLLLGAGCGWTRYRGDTQHTGSNPFERTIGLGELSTLRTEWTSRGRHFITEPIVREGHVFISSRVSIYALDAATGVEQWRRTDLRAPHDFSVLSQPTTGGAGSWYVFVSNVWGDRGGGPSGATNYVLDPTTGATVSILGGVAGTSTDPVVTDDGWVYTATSDDRMLARGQQGEYFSIATPGPVGGILVDDSFVRVRAGSSVLVVGRHGCGQPVCGPLRTDAFPMPPTAVPAQLAENADRVFVVFEATLYAFARSGCGDLVCAPAWTSTSASYLQGGRIAVSDRWVYVSSDTGVHVFDAAGCGASSCAPRWTTALPPNVFVSDPILANGVLYAGSSGGLYAWDAAGCGRRTCARAWTQSSPGAAHPVVADGALYFLTGAPDGTAVRKLVLPS